MPLYRTENNQIADTPFAIWDSWPAVHPGARVAVSDMVTLDIDNDHFDDLVVYAGVIGHDTGRSTNGEIWIYRGGPKFQVDTPAVVIRDDEENNDEQFNVKVGRLDADSIADLIIGVAYRSGTKMKFFQGRQSPSLYYPEPDRVLSLTPGTVVPHGSVLTCDCDGDGRIDFTGVGFGDSAGFYLWRSRTGKDPYSRPFSGADFDTRIPSPGTGIGLGYLNDSSRQYEMLSIGYGSQLHLYSGGPHGPNSSYDAYYDPREDGLTANIYGSGGPMPDVNGDGWDDLIFGNSAYTTFGPNQGIALILAGGPYIPFDTAASDVQQVPAEGHQAGLVLYPNPVHDELHVAWRGDLKRMPERFEAFNTRGERVAGGVVDSWRAEALWKMEGLPAGVYVLTVYDGDGMIVATTEVAKE
jgi:hypothetical protein